VGRAAERWARDVAAGCEAMGQDASAGCEAVGRELTSVAGKLRALRAAGEAAEGTSEKAAARRLQRAASDPSEDGSRSGPEWDSQSAKENVRLVKGADSADSVLPPAACPAKAPREARPRAPSSDRRLLREDSRPLREVN